MSAVDWRADELQRQVAAVRRNLESHDNAIGMLEQDLQIALSAEGEFRDDLAALNRQQFALRTRPQVEYEDEKGFMQFGYSPETLREYEQLGEAIKQREREYQQWVDARRVNTSDGVLSSSWSPRSVTSVQQRIQRLRISRTQVANSLAALEAQLTPGQLCGTGVPAPDLVEHRQRMAKLRERLGIAAG